MNPSTPIARQGWLRQRVILSCIVFGLCLLAGTWLKSDFWSTADQRGDALFRSGKFQEAAKTYADPARIGIAQYRNGDFKEAAATFARVPGAVGAFNQGNALLMHGAYDQAIAAYDRALSFRPDWREAEENKALAIARRDKLANAGQGAATAPEDKPSAITFDLNGENKRTDTMNLTDLTQEDEESDEAFRAVWLRRVQTTPAYFLRTKFSYQAQVRENKPSTEDVK